MKLDPSSSIYQAAKLISAFVAGMRVAHEGGSSISDVQMRLLQSWGTIADGVDRELAALDAEEHVMPAKLNANRSYELLVRVKALVMEAHHGHGTCYELALDLADFGQDKFRRVWINAGEILEAELIK